jgi:DNA-cytosine methyltransferase
MKVLSLFSGIGGYDLALRNMGHKIIGHSEIDIYADKVYSKHFDNKNYGDITKIEKLPDIDILVGGSPCQDLSIANMNREGLKGKRSALFWEYVRILEMTKPKYFIFENVASMSGDTHGQVFMSFFDKKKDAEIITDTLGVYPILIDSSKSTAQRRKRLYRTNIPVNKKIIDKRIILRDILEKDVDKKYYISIKAIEYMNKYVSDGRNHWEFGYHNDTNNDKSKTIISNIRKGVPYNVLIDRTAKVGLYKIPISFTEVRTEESKKIRRESLKNGKDWSPRRGKTLYPRDDGKSNCLTTNMTKEHIVMDEKCIIRKLTPIECQRFQGFPDDWTKNGNTISDTQRYKGLGNAVTVPVIEHILKNVN